MSTPALEQFLAGIYVDAEARARFLAAPYQEAKRAGLSENQCRALEAIDRVGLEMAARSFSRKRAIKSGALARLQGLGWGRRFRLPVPPAKVR
jgi:hypothetical protein